MTCTRLIGIAFWLSIGILLSVAFVAGANLGVDYILSRQGLASVYVTGITPDGLIWGHVVQGSQPDRAFVYDPRRRYEGQPNSPPSWHILDRKRPVAVVYMSAGMYTLFTQRVLAHQLLWDQARPTQ